MAYVTSPLGLKLPTPGTLEPWSTTTYNDNLSKLEAALGAQIAASGALPPSPRTGQIVALSDTGNALVYTGAAWRPLSPAAQVTRFTNLSEGYVDSTLSYPNLQADPTNSTNGTQATAWRNASNTINQAQGITILEPGVYAIEVYVPLLSAVTDRSFVEVADQTGSNVMWGARSSIPAKEDRLSVVSIIRTTTASQQIPIVLYKVNGNPSAQPVRVGVVRLA